MPVTSPLLLLIFNRPEPLQQLLAALRPLAPPKIYIAADGPRAHKAGEAERCERTRQAALEGIDWPCEIETLFRKENLGCRRAVSQGISWFFEQEEAGIILEDDCLPSPDFLFFAQEMLARYAQDAQVFHISGNCFVPPSERPNESAYSYTRLPLIWGWATWRRAWQQYHGEMQGLDAFISQQKYKTLGLPSWFTNKYLRYFKKVAAGEIDTWDYQWTYTLWQEGGLAICPHANLVTNIGFGQDATHTTEVNSPLAHLPLEPLLSPWQAPKSLEHAQDFEASALGFMHGKTALERFWRKLRVRLFS